MKRPPLQNKCVGVLQMAFRDFPEAVPYFLERFTGILMNFSTMARARARTLRWSRKDTVVWNLKRWLLLHFVVILFTSTCFDACFLKLSLTVFHWKGRGTFWSPAPCPMLIMYLIWGTLSDVCSVLMFLPGSAFGCCQNSILAILGYLWNFLCALYH